MFNPHIRVYCPYCGEEATFTDNKVIYGRTIGKYHKVYICRKCDARVGTHKNTRKPLGTMANKELRDWRIKTHEVFDSLWLKDCADWREQRAEAYKLLEEKFGKEIHIGESDIEMCKKIIDYCNLLIKH